MGRQAGKVPGLEFDGDKGEPRHPAHRSALAQGLQQGREDDGGALLLPQQHEEDIDSIPHFSIPWRRNVDEVADEGEGRRDPADAVFRGSPHEVPREGDDVGVAGEGDRQIVESLTRILGVAGRAQGSPERVLWGGGGTLSRVSRSLIPQALL
jgi:hypothetical protein